MTVLGRRQRAPREPQRPLIPQPLERCPAGGQHDRSPRWVAPPERGHDEERHPSGEHAPVARRQRVPGRSEPREPGYERQQEEEAKEEPDTEDAYQIYNFKF